MAGLSITVARLDERELSLWDAPIDTAVLRWGGWSDISAVSLGS